MPGDSLFVCRKQLYCIIIHARDSVPYQSSVILKWQQYIIHNKLEIAFSFSVYTNRRINKNFVYNIVCSVAHIQHS